MRKLKRKTYQLAKINENSSLRGQNGENIPFPKEYGIPTTDIIYIPPADGEEYGTTMSIRYARGEKEIEIDKQSKNAKKGEITAKRGFVFCNENEVSKMKYLDSCNYNGSNPNRDTTKPIIFIEVKEGEMAKDGLRARYRIGELYHTVQQMEPEMVKALCDVFGVATLSNSIDDLRYDLITVGESNVERFYNVLESEDTAVKIIISKAFKQQIIYRSGTHIKLAPSNRVIMALQSENVLSELFDFFMSNKGKDLYMQIKNRVDVPYSYNQEAEVEEVMDVKQSGVLSKYEDMSIAKLVKLATELDVIKRKGPWFKFGEVNLGNKMEAVYQAFDGDSELLNDLKTKLMITER